MSKLTLDEAIKHCLEVAGEQQERADGAEMIDVLDGLDVEACKECAADHRQLAEWLMELKELRKLTIINPIIAGYNEVYEKLRKGDIEASNEKDLLKTAIDTLENVMPKYRRLSEENQKQKEQIAEYKRLLKLAVEDFSTMPCNNDTHSPDSCYICVKHGNCSYTDSFKWCRTDIALKLIGGSENG